MVRKIKKKNLPRKMQQKIDEARLQKYTMDVRADMLTDDVLVLMSCLRCEFGWGQKRIVEFIEKYLEHMADFRLGYFSKSMMIEIIKDELNIDFEAFFKNEIMKTTERFEND